MSASRCDLPMQRACRLAEPAACDTSTVCCLKDPIALVLVQRLLPELRSSQLLYMQNRGLASAAQAKTGV
ncbi:hypothetical protein CYLTODRAFT_422937 [Cylindrobasidium torrendii FP15055 ss-10]|uniref:Uncharacterized protein n=1 Tax=Cylindrobasidium torrendii FP15055 ss-10 TaxID=1314674 RepID=A0A0D7B9S9_9AGAR|nr:hypothetical protein CYLTODRAFT_422937 [Cylindrobasidium torrendii FP15055 ss-10]